MKRKKYYIFITLLITAIVAATCTQCNVAPATTTATETVEISQSTETTTAATTVSETTTTTAVESTATVSDAVTCKSVDSNKKPINKTDTFDAGTKVIYLSLVLNNFTTKDKLTVKWNYLDNNSVVTTTDFTYQQDIIGNYLAFDISLDKGFPTGQYNTEIYLNDKLAETVKFSVK